MTKAGKVRSQTPKVPARERHSAIPKIRVRRNSEKRFDMGRKPGQNHLRRT
ncbi:MAG: 30S ribosomal protein S30e [Candidatus Bathyarchaeia archaeon]